MNSARNRTSTQKLQKMLNEEKMLLSLELAIKKENYKTSNTLCYDVPNSSEIVIEKNSSPMEKVKHQSRLHGLLHKIGL